MTKVTLLVSAMMLTAVCAHAAERPMMPPSPMIDPSGAKATTTRPFAQTVGLGGKTYALNDTVDLNALAAKLGTIAPGQTADASGRFSWVCYTLPAQHIRLWLAAGESGRLDMVTVQASQAPPSASCPAPSANLAPVAMDDAISLGMTADQVTAKLGTPAKSDSGWWVYHRLVDIKDRAGLDEDDKLVVHIDNGKVVYLWALRSASH